MSARGSGAFGAIEVQQVQHALGVLRLEAPELRLAPPARLQRAAERLRERTRRCAPPSAATRPLSVELRLLGIEHTREYQVPGTPFVVDIALPHARLALELRGFHAHLQRRAADECKLRLLARHGWRVEVVGTHHCALLRRAGRLHELAQLIRDGAVDELGSAARELAMQPCAPRGVRQ